MTFCPVHYRKEANTDKKAFLQILNITKLILVLESTRSMLDLFLNFNDSALVQVLLRWRSLLLQQKTVACVHPL